MNIITVLKSINNTLIPSQHDAIYIFYPGIYQKWLPMHNVLQDHQEKHIKSHREKMFLSISVLFKTAGTLI